MRPSPFLPVSAVGMTSSPPVTRQSFAFSPQPTDVIRQAGAAPQLTTTPASVLTEVISRFGSQTMPGVAPMLSEADGLKSLGRIARLCIAMSSFPSSWIQVAE